MTDSNNNRLQEEQQEDDGDVPHIRGRTAHFDDDDNLSEMSLSGVRDFVSKYINDLVQSTVSQFVHDIVVDIIDDGTSEINVEHYVEHVLNIYRMHSHKSQHYFSIITSILAEVGIKAQLRAMFENSFSVIAARDSIKNVIDDILHDFVEHAIPLNFPFTESEKKLVENIVEDKILKEKVQIHVQNVLSNAVKYINIHDQHIASTDTILEVEEEEEAIRSLSLTSVTHSSKEHLARQSSSIRMKSPDRSAHRLSFSLPKIDDALPKTAQATKLSGTFTTLPHRKRGLSKFSPHSEPDVYLAIPELYRLPVYPKPPLPRCLRIPVLSRKNTKIGYTAIMAPTFYLNEALTQVQAKLTKHYNTLN